MPKLAEFHAGTLREGIDVYEPDLVTEIDGEVHAGNGKLLCQIRASITPLIGREFWQAQQVQSQVTHKVRIRYLSALTTTMWFIHDERRLNITSIVDIDNRKRWMEVLCIERT